MAKIVSGGSRDRAAIGMRWRLFALAPVALIGLVAVTQPPPGISAACSSGLTVGAAVPGGSQVTASTFGGPGDPGTGTVGYKGDNLYQHPDSFAELGNGTALGGLPYMTPITVSYQGRSIVLYKRDIGAGGPGLGGTSRAVDLWFQAAAQLGLSGLAVVTVSVGGSGAVPVSATACATVGGATDPAPGASWSRLDMGFDGSYGPAGLVAPYPGIVRLPGITGWPGQGVYFYIVNDSQTGPDYTRAMYFAEGAIPLVPDGTHVVAGQAIGQPVAAGGNKSPGNFEIGPANVTNGDCLAKSYGLGSVGARQEVLAFYGWLRTLGAGPATDVSNAGAS